VAFDSLIGYTTGTITAPTVSSNSYTDSLIGSVSATLTLPGGPYSNSNIGFVTATITAPPSAVRSIYVKNIGAWEPAMISVYDASTDSWEKSGASTSSLITQTSNGQFVRNGAAFAFAGANFYDAITTDAISAGNLAAMPGTNRRAVLDQLAATGHNAIRAHTLFIGYGKAGTQMPTNGVYDEAVLVRCDEFLSECKDRGMYVIAPLTDSWNFYHGGAITFANMVLGGSRTDDQAQIEFCSNPTVLSAFKSYVSTLMNRINTVTGIAWKDDPTLFAIETANEGWQKASFLAGTGGDPGFPTNAGTGNVVWHAYIAAWLKANWPRKFTSDGYACSGWTATLNDGSMPLPYAQNKALFNIVGTHLYDNMRNQSAWVSNEAAKAAARGQAWFVGEYDWRDVANGGSTIQNAGTTRQQFLNAMDADPNVTGMFWWAPRTGTMDNNTGFQLYLDAPKNTDQTSAKAQLITFNGTFKG
jgi:hypothetical protein